MRVLHVIPSVAASDGGPSFAMPVMERALAAAGIEVVTATSDHGRSERGPAVEEIACEGGAITRFYARKAINFYKVAPSLIPWLWTNVKKFDAVHIHALFSFSSLAAGRIAGRRGVPYIVRPLGTLTAYGMTRRASLKRASLALLDAPILRRAAGVHFTSEEEWQEARALKIAMRGVVIPLGVEEMRPGVAARFEAGNPLLEGKTMILFLSRLDPKKNVEAILDAFASSVNLQASAVLALAAAGEAAYVNGLHERARRLGLSGKVLWLGHIEGERKADAFARAGIFVLPSYSENFGIAAVEAMLAGLPSVLGEGVAVAGRASAANAAIAVAPLPATVAGALDRLVLDAGLRTSMGERARAHARQLYSASVMAESLKQLYGSVMTSRARRQG